MVLSCWLRSAYWLSQLLTFKNREGRSLVFCKDHRLLRWNSRLLKRQQLLHCCVCVCSCSLLVRLVYIDSSKAAFLNWNLQTLWEFKEWIMLSGEWIHSFCDKYPMDLTNLGEFFFFLRNFVYMIFILSILVSQAFISMGFLRKTWRRL